MVDKVDDNHNEVLRGAAKLNADGSKYELIVTNETIDNAASEDNSGNDTIVTTSDDDQKETLRDMLCALNGIHEETKKLVLILSEASELDLED